MKKLLSLFLVLCVIICLCGCTKKETQRSEKYFTDEVFKTVIDGSGHDCVYSIKLDPGVKGTTSDDTKLVLVKYTDFSNSVKYKVCIADYANVKADLLNYASYAPLKILYDNIICNFTEGNQTKNLDILYDYITIYGTECFKDNEPSRLYMRRLTSPDGIIDTHDARKLIKDNIISVLPGGDEMYPETDVIFEYKSAVPEYFIYKNPNAGENNIWKALNADFKEMDTPAFATKEEITRFLSGDDDGKDYIDDTDKEENDIDAIDNKNYPTDKKSDDEDKKEESTPPSKEPDLPSGKTEGNDKKPSDGEGASKKESDTLYRVRKSATDSASQLGAFSVFENAKELADANKSDGYKVYDQSGNLVYEP